jgi:integrase
LLEHALPAKAKIAKTEHHAALPYAEVATFMAKLRQDTSAAARCLEFIVLTGARLAEATGAMWSEIDFEARTWIVPASRMKGGREHRVPLSDGALAVLEAMRAIRMSDFVFPGMRHGQPVGSRTIQDLVKELGGEITVHGFRSSFRDWAAERTNFPREVAEMALAHAIPDAVEAAYRRGDLFDKRRKLMDAWAAYCVKVETDAGKVVALARGRTPR